MSDYKRSDSIDIFYQNVRGMHTKCTNFYDNVCINDSKIICITELWLNYSFCNRNLFPDDHFVFRADVVYTDFSLTRGGSVLTAVHQSLSGCKRRYDLELTSELEIKLNPQNFRVVLLGDFNIPGFNWANGFPQANSHYCTRIRGDVVHSAACFLGLSQHNLAIQNKKLLDLVFANFSCVNVTISKLDLVEPDALHPSLVIDRRSIFLSTHSQPFRLSRDYGRADYVFVLL
jgi:hypothetical protein